jgi:O-antigen/teichoic acid export membrane protein
MKNKKDLAFSFLIYGLGLLSLLLTDIYISENFDEKGIAQWAFYKSTIFMIGTICLLGYDQVFVRDKSLIKRYFNKFLFQTVIISTVACIIIYFAKNITIKELSYLALSIFLFALLSFYSAASRACYNLWKSQFSLNFWKILFFCSIFIFDFDDISIYIIISLILSVTISFLLKGYQDEDDLNDNLRINDSDAKKISLAFLFSNITLILSVYGEQFLINLYGNSITSAYLFKYFSIFTPIALSVNSFLGFYLAPKIRKENNMNISKFKVFTLKILLFSVFITLISIVCGLIFITYFSKSTEGPIDYFIIVLLAILSIIRGVYISTSVCLGVFANSKSLKYVAISFWGCTILYVFSIFIIPENTDGLMAARLIVLASLVNWLLRLLFSNAFTIKTLNRLNHA